MIGKHHTRPAVTVRMLPPAVPAAWQAVKQGSRHDPLRSWYAAIGVTMVVFLVVTSIGVISGRSAQGGYPIMVEPQGPALTIPPFNGASPFDPAPPPAGTPSPNGTTPLPGAPAADDRDDARTDPTRDPVTGRPVARDGSTSRPAAPRPGPATTTAAPPRTTSPKPAPPRTTAPKPNPPTTTAPRPDPPTTSAPKPKPPKPSPPRTTPPTTKPSSGNVTARYIVYSSWQNGFTTGIELANNTGRTQTWKLKLIHERSDGVRVKELWNATLKQGGATTNVFIGGELAPGATLHFGFNASKTVEWAVRPTSCKINNRSCSFG